MGAPEVASPEKVKAFKARARSEWTDAEVVAAWGRWHAPFAAQTRAATELIIAAAGVEPGMHVLDVAAGSGEPALALAKVVGPAGHVTATDLAQGMVDVAAANARQQGLTNLSFQRAEAEELPFPDRSFHALTCRFGIMFIPDHARALREVHRVLKPGGRAAFTAWTAPEQPLFALTVGVLRRHTTVPPPEPGAPNVFLFREPGSLRAALEQAGFRHVTEEVRHIPWAWPGTPEDLWQFLRAAGAPVWGPLLNRLALPEREQVSGEVLAAMRPYVKGQVVDFGATVVLASGVR